jgi:nitroimidazol reductase NimA-like FMN-containing flavoprotein (pyridoxamine 5'-phosphate oxidase superfamily)
MKYEMRRKDRQIEKDEALAVVDKALYGTVSFAGDEPYCVSLSLVRDGEWLYFHCAHAGRKTDRLRANPQVCASFVGSLFLPPDDFTLVYESAVVFGTAEEVLDDDEKIAALRLICQRFTPAHMAAFEGAIARQLGATAIWKIHIDEISGKRRKEPHRT